MDLRFQRDIYHGGTLRRDSGQATNPQMTQICNHEKREQTRNELLLTGKMPVPHLAPGAAALPPRTGEFRSGDQASNKGDKVPGLCSG